VKKPVRKKAPTVLQRLTKLEKEFKELRKRNKELEDKVRQIDMDEITEVNDKLHRPPAA
jgi:predicted nuclease with TOPRIM domain